MSTDTENKHLLEQFRVFLDQKNQESLTYNEQPDLNSLARELTRLKTEIKVESKHYKDTLDTLSSALSTIQEDNKVLSVELTSAAERLQQQQTEITRTMLLEIVDIYDRMNLSLNVLQAYRPVKSLFKNSRQKDIHFIDQIKQGQFMTTQRFEQLLQRYQVQTINCRGKNFDPVTMHAIETSYNPKLPSGIVLEELRTGFLFQNQVLRLAEVKVNKIN